MGHGDRGLAALNGWAVRHDNHQLVWLDGTKVEGTADLRHITLDVTLGLPFQDAPRLARTLGQVMRLGVERVRLLGFSPAPERHAPQWGLPLYALPDGPKREQLEATARQLLGEAGYRELGDLHFVLDDDPLAWAADDGVLHQGLLGFSEMRPLAVLGLGAGAAGEIDGQRFLQAPTLAAWSAAVATAGLGVQCAMPVPPRRQAAAEAGQPAGRGLQHGLFAHQGEELLGVLFAGQGPQAGAGATGENNGL